MEIVGAELRLTDFERLEFLLETDAALGLQLEALAAQEVEQGEEVPPDKRPNTSGPSRSWWIGRAGTRVWKHTPDEVESVLDARIPASSSYARLLLSPANSRA